ncbi:hypothetical protein BHE74_00005754 [Ensete ventricosum]|nr:hypothetical protein BHE74_00005754 [Ensete ventricosum]RZR83004.1 hypothetical protein BHM03_00009546 [Ensete ventricosum]
MSSSTIRSQEETTPLVAKLMSNPLLKSTLGLKLNQLRFLMQYFIISGYFHDFTEKQTMMLKVFPDDDLRPTTHDRKKE